MIQCSSGRQPNGPATIAEQYLDVNKRRVVLFKAKQTENHNNKHQAFCLLEGHSYNQKLNQMATKTLLVITLSILAAITAGWYYCAVVLIREDCCWIYICVILGVSYVYKLSTNEGCLTFGLLAQTPPLEFYHIKEEFENGFKKQLNSVSSSLARQYLQQSNRSAKFMCAITVALAYRLVFFVYLVYQIKQAHRPKKHNYEMKELRDCASQVTPKETKEQRDYASQVTPKESKLRQPSKVMPIADQQDWASQLLMTPPPSRVKSKFLTPASRISNSELPLTPAQTDEQIRPRPHLQRARAAKTTLMRTLVSNGKRVE